MPAATSLTLRRFVGRVLSSSFVPVSSSPYLDTSSGSITTLNGHTAVLSATVDSEPLFFTGSFPDNATLAAIPLKVYLGSVDGLMFECHTISGSAMYQICKTDALPLTMTRPALLLPVLVQV